MIVTMSDPSTPSPVVRSMTCFGCGQVYEITAEYLANFAGQETACATCGTAMRVPGTPLVLDYRGPGVSADARKARHWRDGNLLVVEKGAELPPRCARCGRDAPPPYVTYTARWSLAASQVRTTKASVLLFLISHRKRRVTFGLCARHKLLRRFAIALGWAFLAFGVTTFVIVFGFMRFPYPPAGIYVIIAAAVLGILSPFWLFAATAVLEATYIDRRLARFKGASPRFLEGLPAPPQIVSSPGDDMGIVP